MQPSKYHGTSTAIKHTTSCSHQHDKVSILLHVLYDMLLMLYIAIATFSCILLLLSLLVLVIAAVIAYPHVYITALVWVHVTFCTLLPLPLLVLQCHCTTTSNAVHATVLSLFDAVSLPICLLLPLIFVLKFCSYILLLPSLICMLLPCLYCILYSCHCCCTMATIVYFNYFLMMLLTFSCMYGAQQHK